jgi:hypothetical protein
MRWLPCVDGGVTFGANFEGLAPHLGHEVRPRGLWPTRSGEVCKLSDLVNFHLRLLLAELAPARLEPENQLLAAGWLAGGR